ncbi:unannotated protein [freshwater metagenome]|uniref:Unannotated protein n=1 Tax=freshwater metagenome TaxID=449393 RepID=A0A6J7INB0_9ZZZZ
MHHFRGLVVVVVAIASLALASSCSSSSSSQAPTTSTSVAARDMRDLRYCEVLLVSLSESQPIASVYNTYPLNDCPESKWSALDPKALATQFGANVAMLNGPRHWMINHVEKVGDPTSEKADFGGIEMYKQATVPIGSLIDQARPYSPYPVSRSTIFTYNAGSEIFQLTAPDGSVFVMQSFSQQKDPSLTLASLPSLANKLELPTGWKFGSRMLTEDLKIITVKNPAQVLQDNLGNSYSMIPSAPEN